MSGHSELLVNGNYHRWYMGLIIGKADFQELGMQTVATSPPQQES